MVFVLLCLVSLSTMPSRDIHVVTEGRVSFPFCWTVGATSSCIHPLVDASGPHTSAVGRSAAVDTAVPVSFR